MDAQYAPLLGVLELRQAVASYAEAAHPGLAVDAVIETLITLGATEGLACAMLALLNPGDEVNCSSITSVRRIAALLLSAGRGRPQSCATGMRDRISLPACGSDCAALRGAAARALMPFQLKRSLTLPCCVRCRWCCSTQCMMHTDRCADAPGACPNWCRSILRPGTSGAHSFSATRIQWGLCNGLLHFDDA